MKNITISNAVMSLVVSMLGMAAFVMVPSLAHAQEFGDSYDGGCCDTGYSSYPDSSYTAYPDTSYTAYPDTSYTSYPDTSYSTYPDTSYTDYSTPSYTDYSTPSYSSYMPSSFYSTFPTQSQSQSQSQSSTNVNVNTNTCSATNSCNTTTQINAPTTVTTNTAPSYQPVYVPTYQPVYQPQPVVYQQPIAYNQPAPYVSLTAVPYTGLDLGPWGTAAYWGFLILWCLGAAYLIVVKRVQNKLVSALNGFLFGTSRSAQPVAHVAAVSHAPAVKAVAPKTIFSGIDPFIASQIGRAAI